MSTSFHTEEGKSLHHNCTDWVNEKREINSSNLWISLQKVSDWQFMVASLTTHELGNWCVKFATIFSEKWSWGSFYFSTLALKSVTEGIVHWCNGITIWVLECQIFNPHIILLLKGLHTPVWAQIKYKCHIYTYIRRKSFGMCFIQSHIYLSLKQMRYPSFQHSWKGPDSDSSEVFENLS